MYHRQPTRHQPTLKVAQPSHLMATGSRSLACSRWQHSLSVITGEATNNSSRCTTRRTSPARRPHHRTTRVVTSRCKARSSKIPIVMWVVVVVTNVASRASTSSRPSSSHSRHHAETSHLSQRLWPNNSRCLLLATTERACNSRCHPHPRSRIKARDRASPSLVLHRISLKIWPTGWVIILVKPRR